MTNVFLIEIDNIPDEINLNWNSSNLYSRSAIYSFAFLLRDTTARILDMDRSEILVGIKPSKNNNKPSAQIFLSDRLENGAGYSRWLTQDNNLEIVLNEIKRSEEFYMQEEHMNNCDSSCYHCMQINVRQKIYGNWTLNFYNR